MKLAMKWDVGKDAPVGATHNGTQARHNATTLVHRETPHGGPHVLVVDDDANLTRLMATILRTSGIDALTATDGFTALETVAHNEVDAIVLDLQMPQMDGWGFFRALRARGDRTPVLIASAYGAREAQSELGAEASVEKPFDPEVLISELTRIIK